MSQRLAKRVLLIGWDAADWKIIHALREKGWMPTLDKMMQEGAWGNLATLNPILSPMLWNSIGTGKRPDKHGIHGFIEPMPDGKGIRPVTSTSRKCKAVWNILTQCGMKANMLGWFASHPAEPINGVSISNMYCRATKKYGEPWPMAAEAVHPKEMEETYKGLRVHPQELDQSSLQPFIPNAAKIDQNKDRRLAMLAKLLAECVTMHAAATWTIENTRWDLTAVYYDSIDHFCHGFMHYHPPKRKNIKEDDFEMYQDVVVGCYRFHDMMLGRLLQLAGEETTVMLVSDHGYHSDHLRPAFTPRIPAGPAVWHRPQGIFLMKGPGVRKNGQVFGASLLDVTPTVLTLFGLPVGGDMDGKPVVQAFEEPPVVERILSWETVEGECGMHAADKRQDPVEAQEALKQLIELGYIEKPDENAQKSVDNCVRENQYNLARALMDGRKPDEAAPLLEKLVELVPDAARYKTALCECYHTLGRYEESGKLVEGLREQSKAGYRKSLEKMKEKGKLEEGADIDAMVKGFVMPGVELALAGVDMNRRRYKEALERLRALEQAEATTPGLYLRMGEANNRLRRWAEAEKAFKQAIELDGDNATAYQGLAVACLGLKRNEESVEHALKAVELVHHAPMSHYQLGAGLIRIGRYGDAERALKVCLSQAPGMLMAHRRLAMIYHKHLNQPEKAREHRGLARKIYHERAGRRAGRKMKRV